MPREFSRNQRLGNQVLRTLNELLRFESKDPSLKLVSLTAIELTRDLSVGGNAFVEALQRELGVSFEEAEVLLSGDEELEDADAL